LGATSEKFAAFRRRFIAAPAAENGQRALARLRNLARQEPITLVFAARAAEHTNAVVLRDLLRCDDDAHTSMQP